MPPVPTVKRTFPVATDDDNHLAENIVTYEKNVVIRRPYGDTKNTAVQTENPLVRLVPPRLSCKEDTFDRSVVVQTDVNKTKSSSVQTVKSPVKKQRSVQTVAEIKPTTSRYVSYF